MKENDPRNLNKSGIINLDQFLNEIVFKYRELVLRTKITAKNAFKAADLNGDKFLLFFFII